MNETTAHNALTCPEYWEQHVSPTAADLAITFDPHGFEFRDLHAFFGKHLPVDASLRFIEIGCHPGRYLWYFHTQFRYRVSGIEYVASACARTREALDAERVVAEVTHADLFTFEPPGGERYDVVASFGLLEHFRDVAAPLRRHVELLRPGGFLALTAPNHRGLNGAILKRILPQTYALHNQMTYSDLLAAVRGSPEMAVVAGGYLGRFNLAPTNFCPYVRARVGRRTYRCVETLHRWGGRAARVCPNCRCLAPYFAIIARKDPQAR